MILASSYECYKYNEYLKTELPEHWLVKRLGYLAKEDRSAFVDGPFGSDLKSSDYKDDGVPLIQLNNIRDSKHLMQNMKFVTEDKKQQLIRHLAVPGDVVIAKMADPVARSAVVADDYPEYVIVADCVKMTPNLELVDLNYLVWAINSDHVRINAELVSTGTTRIRVNLGELKKLKIPYPSYSEQMAIANFLDHETDKIDTLIEKQQQLIKLLKEKRQAVISHAVTKGLNPSTPMRDSGVEWLGEVPEHWKVAGFKKYLNKIIDYRGKTPEKHDEGVFLVTARNIKNGGIDYSASQEYVSHDDYESVMSRGKPKIGEVLFTTEAPLGEVALVDREDIALAQRVIKFDGQSGVLNNDYLRYLIMSDQFQNSLIMFASGSTALGIKAQRLVYLRTLIPTVKEQSEIVNHIECVIKKVDGLIAIADGAIELMIERRTALISAAVTGKIDVRNWTAPEPSNTANNNNKEVAA